MGLLVDHITHKTKQIVATDISGQMINAFDNKRYQNVITINDELTPTMILQNPVLQDKFDLILAISVSAFLPTLSRNTWYSKIAIEADRNID